MRTFCWRFPGVCWRGAHMVLTWCWCGADVVLAWCWRGANVCWRGAGVVLACTAPRDAACAARVMLTLKDIEALSATIPQCAPASQ